MRTISFEHRSLNLDCTLYSFQCSVEGGRETLIGRLNLAAVVLRENAADESPVFSEELDRLALMLPGTRATASHIKGHNGRQSSSLGKNIGRPR